MLNSLIGLRKTKVNKMIGSVLEMPTFRGKSILFQERNVCYSLKKNIRGHKNVYGQKK